MAENSRIEWCDHTVNLWWGCKEVHAGCDNCYARILAHRRKPGIALWGEDAQRLMIKSAFTDLAKYQRKAAASGKRAIIFMNSMSDIFEKDGPALIDNTGEFVTDGVHEYPTWVGALRDELFENNEQGIYANLLLLCLTKRPSNIIKMIPDKWKSVPPVNVMYGTSPVNQSTYDNLWLHLARVPGKRFLSVEPMLGEIVLKFYCPKCDKLAVPSLSSKCSDCHSDTVRPDWVICGGESGPKRRPFDPDWARSLRDQCEMWGIPFFMKQMDKVIPIPEDLLIRQQPAA